MHQCALATAGQLAYFEEWDRKDLHIGGKSIKAAIGFAQTAFKIKNYVLR
jgi:hypothetical protein